MLEKPLGHDLASNRDINEAVRRVLTEQQIFRIDHYLGKPAVQNLFAMRFGNALFEPVWRREHISNIQITISEDLGVERRGAFYDQTGALRDMVQNHALQLLCALAMEPPINAHADAIRDEKLKVLRSLKRWTPATLDQHVVRGQYTAGTVAGQQYRVTARPASTRTAAPRPSSRCARRSPAGAGPACRSTSAPASGCRHARRIVVNFREAPRSTTRARQLEPPGDQPAAARRPATAPAGARPGEPAQRAVLAPVHLDLDFDKRFGSERVGAYERLLLDVIAGRLNLFVRSDEQEAAWRWVEPIMEHWAADVIGPRPYAAGTWGRARPAR